MGANGSYDKNLGGVPKNKRTHTETGYTIEGHKVLLQTGKESQTKNIMNSNTDNSIYLMAKQNEDGTLTILNINANKGHKIGTEINLVFDSHGNLVPYNGKNNLMEIWEGSLFQKVRVATYLFLMNLNHS